MFVRRIVVKVSLVKNGAAQTASLNHHLDYIERDGAGRDESKGILYGDDGISPDKSGFAETLKDDRHYFKIIVSPEDSKDMLSLTGFTRDFMRHMESDLETRLEWVAADHYDTSVPHTHIVLRGKTADGKDLVIPRAYISRGMRELAAELVTKELGYIRQMDAAMKLAAMVPEKRFTLLDKSFVTQAKDNVLDLSAGPDAGSEAIWRLDMGRLKRLGEMGLVEKTGRRIWKLDEGFERTLRRMGERGDIIRTYQRAMTEAKLTRQVHSDEIYDPFDAKAQTVTGRVVKTGLRDDVSDRSYMVLDCTSGEALYVDTGGASNIEGVAPGMTVQAKPKSITPRPSDYTIDTIAHRSGGRYSVAAHMETDKEARPQFIEAHIRRLEAMRRAGHAEREKDGTWTVPPDYLKRAARFEKSKALAGPVDVRIVSGSPLKKLAEMMGRTWLDEQLVLPSGSDAPEGFGQDVETAKTLRRKFLLDEAVISALSEPITSEHLQTLEARDVADAASDISSDMGKPFAEMPASGKISGTYVKAVNRPSGRYGVIERSKDFTLVPWRETLERNPGRSVTGDISGHSISWTLTKGREIS
ncbi:DUF3363 domain-containing protein [Robiginitomaculum antarcticum]|uniref:DUF3363 domain-containing protein n=1 Tax=Robiginitomaculum antarcticum TaxID=437507 RepID=UPI0003685C32|nr:DUF3363 domain-containing protein [Robiginitomaculum antarcticum]